MAEHALQVGIDIGGTSIKAGAVCEGRVVHREQAPTPSDFEDFIDTVADLARQVADGPPRQPVGVGVPGFSDPVSGRIHGAPNLPFLHDMPMQGALEEALGVPVLVENDANVAAWAEACHGAGREHRDFLLATIGTGIGGGLVLDGKLFRGPGGQAGEFGHLSTPHQRRCNCGAIGCLEAAVSARSLADWAREEGLGVDDLRDLAHLARQNHALARSLFQRAGAMLGEAFAQVALLLDLRVFLVGGGGAPVLDLMEKSALQVLSLRAFGREREDFRLVCAELGNDAGFLGAAALASLLPEATRG